MEFNIDEKSPIFAQIVETIKEAILRGELAPGEKLPSQRELAVMAKVNPNTVQRAYGELEHLGITETRRGEGTFVNLNSRQIDEMRNQKAKGLLLTFFRRLRALGYSDEQIRHWLRTELQKGGDQNDRTQRGE